MGRLDMTLAFQKLTLQSFQRSYSSLKKSCMIVYSIFLTSFPDTQPIVLCVLATLAFLQTENLILIIWLTESLSEIFSLALSPMLNSSKLLQSTL